MFLVRNQSLHCEEVALTQLAQQFGTPLYVYSRSMIEQAYLEFANAGKEFNVLFCFGMKANSNLSVLSCLEQLGAGFDIVSGGELERVLRAGAKPEKIVFSGVGKSAQEIAQGLAAGIKCFNVESEAELDRIQEVAQRLNKTAAISLRVNPNVDAGTHPYISTGLKENKFGVEYERALAVYAYAKTLPNLAIEGIDCHIGSQITEIAPFIAAMHKVVDLYDALGKQGIHLRHIDLGGGLGIDYNGETPPERAAFIEAVFKALESRGIDAYKNKTTGGKKVEIVFEFGRSLVGNAGVLLTKVEYLKKNGEKNFAVVDAAMNDLLRPTLYQAFHKIEPVIELDCEEKIYDIVGPVCESGDWLGKARSLKIQQHSLLAIRSAGAYGIGMSSNYNTRNRAAEVLVSGSSATLIRKRETFDHQLSLETDGLAMLKKL
jgi:diaminopimelate decarboxylase